MPRGSRNGTAEPQGGIFDTTIEDQELESMLEEALRLEPDVKAYRKYKKDARALIEKKHEDAINVEGAHGGWVRVGRHRFRAKKSVREEGEVKIGAGFNFKLEIELA